MKVWVVTTHVPYEGSDIEAVYMDYPSSEEQEKYLWIEYADGSGKFKRSGDVEVHCVSYEVIEND